MRIYSSSPYLYDELPEGYVVHSTVMGRGTPLEIAVAIALAAGPHTPGSSDSTGNLVELEERLEPAWGLAVQIVWQ